MMGFLYRSRKCLLWCVALTCAFIWNTGGFNISWAQLTVLLALLHPFLLLSVFVFPFLFMLFGLFPGLAAGWKTRLLAARRDRATRRWCTARGGHRRAREHWRGLAEPLRGGQVLRVTVSPVMAGVIADVRQGFKWPRDVQHRELLGAGRRAAIRHRNCHSSLSSACLSSPAGKTKLAVDWRCHSLAGEVRYPGLFVGEGVDEVGGGSFLLGGKTKARV